MGGYADPSTADDRSPYGGGSGTAAIRDTYAEMNAANAARTESLALAARDSISEAAPTGASPGGTDAQGREATAQDVIYEQFPGIGFDSSKYVKGSLEYQQANQNLIQAQASYHHAAVDTGLPQPTSGFESAAAVAAFVNAYIQDPNNKSVREGGNLYDNVRVTTAEALAARDKLNQAEFLRQISNSNTAYGTVQPYAMNAYFGAPGGIATSLDAAIAGISKGTGLSAGNAYYLATGNGEIFQTGVPDTAGIWNTGLRTTYGKGTVQTTTTGGSKPSGFDLAGFMAGLLGASKPSAGTTAAGTSIIPDLSSGGGSYGGGQGQGTAGSSWLSTLTALALPIILVGLVLYVVYEYSKGSGHHRSVSA